MSMRTILSGLVLACSFSAMAGETLTTIGSVVRSRASNRLLVLSTADGRVYKTDNSRTMRQQLDALRGRPVYLRWDQQGSERVLTQVAPGPAQVSQDIDFFTPNANRDVPVTDLADYAAAERTFNSLDNTNKTRSQCFKRAHMWAFDMWSRLGIQGQKIFIFYTRRYIEMQDFDWWFHVAPVVRAGGVDYAFDRAFTDKPLTIQQWKDKFLSPKITCPTIEHYDQYENNQWNRLCYLRLMPMWYFRPADIRDLDRQGRVKNAWDLEELQDSRRAFENGEETYEALDTGRPTITH